MNIKKFIDRPILSGIISMFIVILGAISLTSLPIEQYPDIAPPTIYVWCSYPGASAETVQKSVVVPLEEAINGVENMIYMTSSASNDGSASVVVFFKQGTNADMAAVNVQNRVSQAVGLLPAEVVKTGVITEKQQPGTLRTLAIESPNGTYDEAFIGNYFRNNLRPQILRIAGVGKVEVYNAAYSLRVWLNPELMAQYNLVPSDITAVIEEQNQEAAIGSLGENADNVFKFTMRYRGRKSEITDFENMIIRTAPTGEVLKLKDVATIELGLNDYSFTSEINGNQGVMGMISQVAGSNATTINLEIDKLLKEVEKTMPKDLRFVHFENTNDYLFASIRSVVSTLILAIILVLLIVYFFLQDFRATLIPTIGILVSLIGTFAFISVAGFSLNLLTLFALVLVIGTVVDDSVVVVEAVQARFDSGYKSSYRASVDAMNGLVSALITTTLVFMVVFIPVSFLGGTSGVFYRQFGLTMAVAVAISTINALTLSPALCALILRPSPESGEGSRLAERVRKAYQSSYNAVIKRYTDIAMAFIKRKWLVWSSVALSVVLLSVLMTTTQTGLVPDEDMGVLYVDITTPAGYSIEKTDKVVGEVIAAIKNIDAIESVGKVSGMGIMSGSGSNTASLFVQLKNWSERKDAKSSASGVIDKITERTANIISAGIYITEPGMISGYGKGGGFEFSVQNRNDADIATFYEVTQNYLEKLRERPEISAAHSAYNINYPQYVVDVDVAKCKLMGVSPSAVLDELGAYYGGSYISNINKFSKVYQVIIQADPEYRSNEHSLNNIFVRAGDKMLPIGQFLHIEKEYGPINLDRFNMFTSIGINGENASGYSSGDALKAIQEVALKELPIGYSVDFSGISREQNQGGNNTMFVFIICLGFVYMVMAGLYESLFIPFAIILSVPFGLMGSFLFAKIFGVENNIYLQIGLIMLIGLLAKTAILLTEYASQCRQAGLSIKQSAFFAAKVRLRPILMTSLTMVFGMLPLMFATGVGANGSQTIGVGIVGGMLIGTLGLLFVVPALFVAFQSLQERFKPIEFKEPTDPMLIEELRIIKEKKQ